MRREIQFSTKQIFDKDSGIQNQMQKKLPLILRRLTGALILMGLPLLQACSFPGVYKINVQQGNIVTTDMLERLKPGMSRGQIHFALGNPVIENVFNNEIEHYIYTYQKAGGRIEYQKVVIYYDGDIYKRHEAQLLSDHPAY